MYWVNVLLELVKRDPHCAKFGLIYANGVDGLGYINGGGDGLILRKRRRKSKDCDTLEQEDGNRGQK